MVMKVMNAGNMMMMVLVLEHLVSNFWNAVLIYFLLIIRTKNAC